MPPQRRGKGCFRHCVVWYGRDGQVTLGCMHCPAVFSRHTEEDEELLGRQVAASRASHAATCPRKVR